LTTFHSSLALATSSGVSPSFVVALASVPAWTKTGMIPIAAPATMTASAIDLRKRWQVTRSLLSGFANRQIIFSNQIILRWLCYRQANLSRTSLPSSPLPPPIETGNLPNNPLPKEMLAKPVLLMTIEPSASVNSASPVGWIPAAFAC